MGSIVYLQATCRQGSASEVMILRTARRYDLETDTIIFANGTPMTRESMRFGGTSRAADCRAADIG